MESIADTRRQLPHRTPGLLKDLGVSPIDKISLVLADDRTVEYDIGRTHPCSQVSTVQRNG